MVVELDDGCHFVRAVKDATDATLAAVAAVCVVGEVRFSALLGDAPDAMLRNPFVGAADNGALAAVLAAPAVKLFLGTVRGVDVPFVFLGIENPVVVGRGARVRRHVGDWHFDFDVLRADGLDEVLPNVGVLELFAGHSGQPLGVHEVFPVAEVPVVEVLGGGVRLFLGLERAVRAFIHALQVFRREGDGGGLAALVGAREGDNADGVGGFGVDGVNLLRFRCGMSGRKDKREHCANGKPRRF